MSVTEIQPVLPGMEPPDLRPVFTAEWRVYVCWARSGRMGPLPGLSGGSEDKARERAAWASHQKGIRFIAVYTGGCAYPAALYLGGRELTGQEYEEALLTGRN